MYPKYESRECARCHRMHSCTLNIHCSCMDAEITEKILDQISCHYNDCLCSECLEELKKNRAADPSIS